MNAPNIPSQADPAMPRRKHLLLEDSNSSPPRPEKRRRLLFPPQPRHTTTKRDLLSPLSDELLVRILSFLSLRHLLAVAPVSRRFHRLADDSQLWKGLYYTRFVLPRALRVPGTRQGQAGRMLRDHKLHYKGNQTLWADGRLGGLVKEAASDEHPAKRLRARPAKSRVGEHEHEHEHENNHDHEKQKEQDDRAHWKRQYKIRHNWALGKCAVEELKLNPENVEQEEEEEDGSAGGSVRSSMLVKVVEGLAVTADRTYGLRVWDLKTRQVMAQIDLLEDPQAPIAEHASPPPSCMAVDDRELEEGTLNISIGFADGSFGVWRLSTRRKQLVQRYRHTKSSNGELIAMAYLHPHLLTATRRVLISLYTFDVPEQEAEEVVNENDDAATVAEGIPPRNIPPPSHSSPVARPKAVLEHDATTLPAPYLLTSLESLATAAPLALSLRKSANTTIASIASTFSTRSFWAVRIQDLLVTPHANPKCPPRITTALAFSEAACTPSHYIFQRELQGPPPPAMDPPPVGLAGQTTPSNYSGNQLANGPVNLCYSHPYLLVTLPDNTLSLFLCNSTVTRLSISPGIRLFGHTSGISRAEITARGKAVSVSSRGDEVRLWELEGRPNGVRSRSVEIRAAVGASAAGDGEEGQSPPVKKQAEDLGWEERRNWVGFDDEMVIVLKEAKGGRESLLVYDFT